jgi:hypothetical protein
MINVESPAAGQASQGQSCNTSRHICPRGAAGAGGAMLDKNPHRGRCPEHVQKLIPAGLLRRFARLALWCVQGFPRFPTQRKS